MPLDRTSATDARAWTQPSTVLAWTLFLVPAVGVPSELMLQDTLKSAVAAFGILGAALLFFWQQRQRSTPLQWHGLVWLPLVLMGYALGSMAWSHTYLAGVEAIRWFLFALLLWLGLNTLTPHTLPRLLWGIHAGAVVASLWAALQFWLDLNLFPQGAFPASTFINRNFLAEYLVCTLPFSVYLLAQLRSSRWLPLVAGSLALNLVALMMTGTRSALVALWVMVPVLVLIGVRYRHQLAFTQWNQATRLLVGVVLLAGVGVLGSIPSDNPRVLAEHTGTTPLQRSLTRTASVAQPTEYTEGSFSIRAEMWMSTARMLLANPLTGVGAGAWEVQIPLYQRTYTTLETDYYAHNEYLQLLSEYGALVGGLVLAVLLAYLLLTAGSTWRLQGPARQDAPLRAIALTSLLALLVVSNAGFPWRLAGTGVLFALCLAILADSDARLGLRDAFFAARLPWRPVASRLALGVLAGCCALALVITGLAVQAERAIVGAIHLGNAAARARNLGQEPPPELAPQLLQSIRLGVAINPHYRKFTAIAAEHLSASGDYANAARVLESVANSRPHLVAVWAGLAFNYAQSDQPGKAQQALQQMERLRPSAIATQILRVSLLSRAGKDREAIQLLTKILDEGHRDFELLQTGYALGLKTNNPSVAIRSLELFDEKWPEHAADTNFRLGKIYANPTVADDTKALIAFKKGMTALPAKDQDSYRNQLPQRFREYVN